MTDADRVKAAFLLGMAHVNVATGASPQCREFIEKAVSLLAGESMDVQGWGIGGNPLK